MSRTIPIPPLVARAFLALACAWCGVPTAQVVERAPPHPLVGRWTWTRPANQCRETYVFRSDGTFAVTSGAERSEGRYRVAERPDAAGFYHYTDQVTRDYGGRDCAESAEDHTGAEANIYILLHDPGDEMLLCYEPSLDKCFGPLRKVSPQ